MSRVALIGSNGQLGSDIARIWARSSFGQRGDELVGLTHPDLEVKDADQVRSVLIGLQPSIVINTSAFHRVDDCEEKALEAFEVNAVGVKNLAEACRDTGALLVHFTTDYVFDGLATKPYTEDTPTSPISAYGVSKAAGEHFLRYLLPGRHVLVRTSGLYGFAGASGKGGNFVETMLRMQAQGRAMRVVDDQVSAPTHTQDVAETLLTVLERGDPGTYHITNLGACSWYEFAAEIFRLAGIKPDLTPVSSKDWGSLAARPAYSVLDNGHLRALGIPQPRPWQAALEAYLQIKGVIGRG